MLILDHDLIKKKNRYKWKTVQLFFNKTLINSDLFAVISKILKKHIKNIIFMLQPSASTSKQPSPISFFELFRFASKYEKFSMILACICSMGGGASMPLFILVFGQLTNSLSPPAPGETNPSILSQAGTYCAYFIYIGLGTFFCNGLSMTIFLFVSERISGRIRKAYFDALLKQEIGWFDQINPNELASKVLLETLTIQQGIGDKIPAFLMASCTIIAAFVMGFARGWQLALVMCAAIPVLSLAGAFFGYVLTNIKRLTTKAYIYSSALAEQCLNAIKTVKSLSGEEYELRNFSFELKKAIKITIKNGILVGVAIGLFYFSMFSSYGLGYWFGSITIENKWSNSVVGHVYTVGDVLTVFFSVMMAAMFLGHLPPPLKAFAAAKQAGSNVFFVLDRKPKIILNDPTKKIAEHIEGDIKFENVDFSYPSRENIQVLRQVSCFIEKNKKTAFVGESGSGKSTIIALIERFYDVNSGEVQIDGMNIKEYNLNSLRKKIGYVGQEPVLFSGTVRENLLFGKEEATEEELYSALHKANAFEFVNNLQNKLDTFIGIGGSQLSGGQKQRLAIARAILKNPPILLLDEATSALDRNNEMTIQKTLDEIASSKTTIVVAHRLSTIQDADRIYLIADGRIEDCGTHNELIQKSGKYLALFKMQMTETNQESVKNEEIVLDILYDEKSKRRILTTNIEEESLVPHIQKNHCEINIKENDVKVSNKSLLKKEFNLRKKKVFRRIFGILKENFLLFFFGCLGSAINGAVIPFQAIILGSVLEDLALCCPHDFRSEVNFLSGMFVVIAVVSFFANLFQSYLLSILGEKVAYKMKVQAYEKTLRKPLSFFDDPNNNPGMLSTKISMDTQQVETLASTFIGVMIQAISGFMVGMIIAFVYSWKLTLVALGLSPLLFIGLSARKKMYKGFGGEDAYQESGSIIMETVVNMRTVASFCNENFILQKYLKKIEIPIGNNSRQALTKGFTYGFSYFMMFVFRAVIFYIAAVLQDKTGLSLKEFFIAMFAIMLGAGGSASSATFLPDIGEGVKAAENVFAILDSQEQENYEEKNINNDLFNNFQGKIQIKHLYFKYPSRDKYVFEDFNLQISPGKKIAFVGPSGCG